MVAGGQPRALRKARGAQSWARAFRWTAFVSLFVFPLFSVGGQEEEAGKRSPETAEAWPLPCGPSRRGAEDRGPLEPPALVPFLFLAPFCAPPGSGFSPSASFL